MMESDRIIRFHWADYLLFGLVLLVSAAIGIYYGIIGSKQQQTTKDFFLGGRNMKLLPVTLSILASFMSAVSVLGTPSEIYSFGTLYVMLFISYFITFPIAAQIYLPMFHKLQLTSAHEYLELRFNRVIRILVSAVFILQMLLYMAIVIYAPALAFSQVSGLPMWVSVLSIGLVCTFYTALGGMKAVMWTDVFQMLIVYAGLLAVVIQGVIMIGGFGEVWDRALEGGRIKFIDFNPSPYERHTLWTLVFGGTFTVLSIYGSNQAMIQRYLSMRKLEDAQKAVYIAMIATFLFLVLLCLTGVVMYAYYHGCDPIKQGLVTRGDQLLPLMVLEVLGVYPGLAGLVMSCVFSAALSTVSSGVNSLATVFLEDLIKPIYYRVKELNMEEGMATVISKILAVVLGFTTLGLAFLAKLMPSTLVQISLSIFGMAGGPILAVFTVGMFLPFVNSWGAGVGFFLSIVTSFWLGIGAVVVKHPLPVLPVSTNSCAIVNTSFTENGFENMTTILTTMSTESPTISVLPTTTSTGYSDIYKISYLYYSPICIIVMFLVAPLVSWMTGFNRRKKVDRRLIYPLCDRICCCLPERVRRFLRCETQTFVIAESVIPTNQSQVVLTDQDASSNSGEVNFANSNVEECPIHDTDVVLNGKYQSLKQRTTDETEGL
ncbi:sodium-coupled monocarboxylate transporter 1-like isoform X2 [Lineus longissimus]|uniref:sodium-coupled monocarboxylate transporter 1-like isoform X2 n=1 Tax=Lineus longissimus TaxID=88925 RepID=UPI002B4ED32B